MEVEAADAVLAIDLGKTGCRAALFQAGRRWDAEGPGAPGLAAPGGVQAAEAAILAAARKLPRGATVACAGVAGAMAAPEAAAELAERLCHGLTLTRVAVCGDVVAAHAGALAGRPGVVLVAGTGAVALAITPEGAVRRSDGWGPWLGDEGGGAALGLAGLRAVLRAVDRRGPATALTARAARFGPPDHLPAALEADGTPARTAAAFAPDVAAAAQAGDPVAAALMRQAAEALAATVRAVAWPGAAVAITGGLWQLGPGLTAPFRAALSDLVPLAAAGSALDGARRLATDTGTVHEAALHRAVARSRDALAGLATEGVMPGLEDLDRRTPGAVVQLVLEAERDGHAALAAAAPALAAAADAVAERMRRGGRLFYLGAGTPGRLATLDAAELGPTYNAPPDLVVALLAGGVAAMVNAAEGAEDDEHAAAAALEAQGLGAGDAVVGIAASGRTPFVVAGLRHARAAGALTVAIVNNPASPAAAAAELAVEILTGPEIVAGSTRMKAGTSQKVALNALSTACMVALGKTYGSRMVDVRATNEKLRRRARRMAAEIAGRSEAEAELALAASGGRVKPAVVALLAGVTAEEAERLLQAAGGRVRETLEGLAR